MKTSEITPAEFSARFGTQHIIPGSYSYFACDNGVGVIRDNSSQSIEIVASPDMDSSDITPEDELMLLSLVCGDYKQTVDIPRSDHLLDYEARNTKASLRLAWIWTAFFLFVALCVAIAVYLY
ncbi:hypothetical protein [Cohnella lupini]|uniref:hypothetical protein n=1 Tax=Cohnella lupini TaxID=1294267 RepID=UPI000E255B9E|nr:hypothetical protein [Cohnella lupini]